MKKLSILFAALLISVSNIFAADVVYKTISFAADNNTRGEEVGSYTKTWESTTNGFTVSIANFNNNKWDKWNYIKCGRKNNASVATITTKAAIDKAITKVVVTIDDVTADKVNSATLTVASDAEFTKDVQTITVTAAKGELPYVVTTPTENMYYKLTYDCKSSTKNGFVQISKIEYYITAPDIEATAIALDQTELELEQYKYVQLVATLTPADATTEVVWTSSNDQVATVANGLVTIVAAEGTATITATAGTVSATCEVTAKSATVLTCAEAAQKALSVSADNEVLAGGKYVIRGYVTALAGTPSTDFSTYGNYSVWLADTKDGDKVFEAYQVKPVDGKTVAKVGDYVEIVGDLTKYNNIPETVGKQNATIAFLADPTPQPAVFPYCQTEVGHSFAENADPNSYVLLSIGSKNGKTIVRIDQDAAKNSAMFDYLQVTTLATTGADVDAGGEKAMAVEFDTPAADADGNITLEILWSTIAWPGRWMVKNVKVPATAECEHAVLVGPSTALDATVVAPKATKRLINGVLVIEKDGVLYTAQGAKL